MTCLVCNVRLMMIEDARGGAVFQSRPSRYLAATRTLSSFARSLSLALIHSAHVSLIYVISYSSYLFDLLKIV